MQIKNKIVKNELSENSFWIMGYEPYFHKDVFIARIHEATKEIRPCHGYFCPHPYGKKVKAFARRNGYNYSQ